MLCDSYDWRNAKVSPVVWLWWGLFVAAYVVELATSYQVVVGTVTTIDTKSTGGSIAASACRIAAAAFFIVVIRRLTGRQEAAIAAASTAAPVSWGAHPVAAGGAPVPPPVDLTAGWKADPTGRGAYRYWDGMRWTEHAAIDGRTFSSPIV